MNLFIKGLTKVNRIFFSVSVFLLCGSTIVAVLNAVARKFFPGLGGFTWAEELSTYLAVLMLFIGVAYLELTDNHLCIGILKNITKGLAGERIMQAARVFRGALTLFIMCIVLRYGFVVLYNMINRGMVTYALRISKSYFFIPMIIGVAMTIAVWVTMLVYSKGKEADYNA